MSRRRPFRHTAPRTSTARLLERGAACWPPLALAALVVLAFSPAFDAGFIWDDDAHVTKNPTLSGLDGLRRIWLEPTATPQYYPLVHTTFWIERRLWGLQPAGYHAVNIVLHAANAVLVWLVLRRLEVPGAWLAAAIFAVHPVHVETVAWVSERKNLLSLFFYLAALLVWLQSVAEPNAFRGRWYAAVLLLFTAALLSKTVACSLPAVMLILAWWRHGRIPRRDIVLTAPLFALGLAFAGLTAYLEKHHVLAQGDEWDFSPSQRLLIAGRAVWFYAGKLVWPTHLSFIYERWTLDAASWRQWLFPVSAVALVGALWGLRRRVGRGPLAAALFFGGTLVPALGFVNVYPMRYSFVADHFQYAASLGLIALAAAGAALAVRRLPPANQGLGWAARGVVLAVLAVLAWRQSLTYRDALSLWAHTVAESPNSWMPCHQLGNELFLRGEYEAAIGAYQRSLHLRPRNVEVHTNLAAALEQRPAARPADLSAAREHYLQALEIDPDWHTARNRLGLLLIKQQEFSAAAAEFERILAARPGHAEARNNLGTALELLGRRDEAMAQYRAALEIDPRYADAHYNLANGLFASQQLDSARQHYEQALRLQPTLNVARNNLAGLRLHQGEELRRRGDEAGAVNECAAALALYADWLAQEPASHIARQNLAAAGQRLQAYPEVAALVQQALRTDPGDPALSQRLAALKRWRAAKNPRRQGD